METHKSLHICTDKRDWMLYPWLPSHVICIIFITKAFSGVFSSPEPPANMMYTDSDSICEGSQKQAGWHGEGVRFCLLSTVHNTSLRWSLLVWFPFRPQTWTEAAGSLRGRPQVGRHYGAAASPRCNHPSNCSRGAPLLHTAFRQPRDGVTMTTSTSHTQSGVIV